MNVPDGARASGEGGPVSDRSGAVLAIDPGSGKCGVAVVARSLGVLHREIAGVVEIPAVVGRLCEQYRPRFVLIGDGTGTRRIQEALADVPALPEVLVVDERYTSQEARVRYLRENPPRGWQRLLPPGLRIPPVPYDDYVAVLLAERFLAAL